MTDRAEYLPIRETSKLVRAALKKAFPGVKFSVRSESYSMGQSVRVSWPKAAGLSRKVVDEVAGQFEGKGFDGSIDMGYSLDRWLLPDGSAVLAHCQGTQGSMGYVPAQDVPKPHPDARLICTGAYVSCQEDWRD